MAVKGDTSLVRAAQAGDRAAFGALYARHRLRLVAAARRVLQDAALAEDAAQEAAVVALLGIRQLKRPEHFLAWLIAIALNISRAWLKERSRESWSWEALHGGRQEGVFQDRRVDPAALAEEAEMSALIRHAVAELPRGQRDAVALFYLGGLSYAEIAAGLGIDVGAVRSRLHKGRAALRRDLEPLLEEDTMSMTNPAAPVAMRVVDVRRMPAGSDHPARFVVILEDTGGTRRLPIWVGPPEGIAIALQLERIELPRPPAYRFVANVFLAAGARLREARINRLEDQTFYAIAVVERAGGKRVEVDARPSDVISLALHLGTPIVVDPAVLDAVGAQPEASCAEEENRTDAARAAQIAAEVRASWPAPPSA